MSENSTQPGRETFNISDKQLKLILDLAQQLGKNEESQEKTASAPPPTTTANTTTPDATNKQTSSTGATPAQKENQNPEDDEQTSNGGVNGKWEPTLTHKEDELMALQELGLGVAVDITAKHPWVTKSAFQAKSVTSQDLIVINESNKFHKSKEHVEKYSDIQAGLESSFRPDPSTPINVTVAADFHRSNARAKTIDSRTLLTRTVAFRAKVPFSVSDKREPFEEDLHQWLVEKELVKKRDCTHDSHDPTPCECPKYDPTTNYHCINYLKELGGVTHYVSSITLGATRYQVSLNSTVFASLSSSSGIKADALFSASAKSKISKKVFQSNSKEQRIGNIPDDNSNVLQFRTKGEAVVKCSYNSLANLVSNAELRKMLELGIHEYIDSKKNGTRGPYHIATAELMTSKDEPCRGRLYWKIEWENPDSELAKKDSASPKIKYTPDVEAASNFYIKPIISAQDGDKYFRIATDPEDCRGFEKLPPKRGNKNATSKTQSDKDRNHQALLARKESSSVDPEVQRTPDMIREPQRYVNVVNKSLVVELVAKHDKKDNSTFKIKSVHDSKSQPLCKSQWLPEAIMGSQPHYICCKGMPLHTIKKRLWSVYLDTAKECIMLDSHQGSHEKYSYFILEVGHPT